MKLSRSTSEKDAGFTLVEMLVALALFGLIAVLALGGLHFGARVWENGGARAEATDEVAQVQYMLHQLIAQSRGNLPNAQLGGEVSNFVGSATGLSFVAPLPAHRGVGGLYRFQLTAVGDSSDIRLVLTWGLKRHEDPAVAASLLLGDDVLLRGVTGVSIRYFGSATEDSPPSWHHEWQKSDWAPQLVDIKVRFGADDPRIWPDFVAARALPVRVTP